MGSGESETKRSELKRDLKVVKALGILVLVVLLVIIIVQNTEAVETRLLIVTVTMPRALLLFVHLAMGYLLGILTMLFMSSRGRRKPQT